MTISKIAAYVKYLYSNLFKLYAISTFSLVVLFTSGVVLGFVLPVEAKLILLEAIGEKFASIINAASTDFELALGIIKNNILVSLIVFALGFTLVVPIFVMVSNGMVIGVFFSLFANTNVVQPGLFVSSLISIIPHGIFELTAFFLAGGLSLTALAKLIVTKKIAPQRNRKQFLLDTVGRFIVIIIPMLIVAGFIEVYISHIPGEWYQENIAAVELDEALAIAIPANTLESYHCEETVPASGWGTESAARTGSTLLEGSRLVFDETIHAQFTERANASFWQVHYLCDDDQWISIQTWSSSQWSSQQALSLQRNGLAISESMYEEVVNNTSNVSTQLSVTSPDGFEYTAKTGEVSGITFLMQHAPGMEVVLPNSK